MHLLLEIWLYVLPMKLWIPMTFRFYMFVYRCPRLFAGLCRGQQMAQIVQYLSQVYGPCDSYAESQGMDDTCTGECAG